MSDVFISYAREDRERARQLADVLEQQRWTVWWDREIPPGRSFSEVIAEQLASAKAIIVLWSAFSIDSNWVKDEAQEGASRRMLVPARIDRTAIPYGFRQLQTADLSDWRGEASHPELRAMQLSIARLINKPAVVAPPTAWERLKYGVKKQRLGPAVLLLVVLVLAFAGYQLFGDNKGTSVNPPDGTGALHDRDARIEAAKLTAEGLSLVDPGGNHRGAILLFSEAVNAFPDYAEAYFYRGQSHVALGQTDRAVRDFEKVVALQADDLRAAAAKFIRDIQSPPRPEQTDVSNTDSTKAPVGDLFSDDKSRRITGTTRFILEKRSDPQAVSNAVQAARANPNNASGVLNTLVYLQRVDPAILKQQQPQIESLLNSVEDPKMAEHVQNVRKRLQ